MLVSLPRKLAQACKWVDVVIANGVFDAHAISSDCFVKHCHLFLELIWYLWKHFQKTIFIIKYCFKFRLLLCLHCTFIILDKTQVIHTLLILFQATVLLVAFNSHNKALLTVMMSNNVSTCNSSRATYCNYTVIIH